ncbi:glycosyltransferase family A protein [Phaeobacter sp. J2-8]|uniref:glycosyltransferase family A protein n=1 Tax=Phaeobacter sp. J2-8 TaxID=2931394 RepID=UPI001FD5396E|nr:glycosyltransferase family A protein [Phaeobacter sp. J2-8]MCJ7874832.1 glycosyltransferase family 2 protein [Phaeobacter sp. J2-8]
MARDGRLAHAVERLFGLLAHQMGGRIALASAAETQSEILTEHGFPAAAPRTARPIMEVLEALHHRRISARLDAMLAKEGPKSAAKTHHRSNHGLGYGRLAAKPMTRSADYAILTPTGDRAAAFARCAQMVADQSLQPRQWVIVDDGRVPLTDQMPLPEQATYVRRAPHPEDPPHTLSSNLLAGLPHIEADKVLIFEDDDWYAPLYSEYLLPFLDNYQLVGLQDIRYYHLRGSAWKHGHQPKHTAFAQSAFRRGHAWAHLEAVCRSGFPHIRERGLVDRHWWQSFEGSKRLIDGHPGLSLGIKGGFGRPGLASGHDRGEIDYLPDPDGSYLKNALGPDCAYYARWQRNYRKPYVLYTTCPDGQTRLAQPQGALENFDLFAFCTTPLSAECAWEGIPFDQPGDAGALRAQVLPHLYFPDYEWSVWVDPALAILGDLDRFVTAAIAAQTPLAFCPAPDGGPDCRVMVRRHTTPEVTRAMVRWWQALQDQPPGQTAPGTAAQFPPPPQNSAVRGPAACAAADQLCSRMPI